MLHVETCLRQVDESYGRDIGTEADKIDELWFHCVAWCGIVHAGTSAQVI